MDIRTQIITNAERVFDHHGFAGTGMDQVTQAAEVSSRTLYKHVGNKTALIVAVLNERSQRFFSQCRVTSVEGLFDALECWTLTEGARGCLFLRADGETGGKVADIAQAVSAYRTQLRELIKNVVAHQFGVADDSLAEQILVLFEGATSSSTYRGTRAISAARTVAAMLMDRTDRMQ
ncbi:TetR/AcrR family transcriptional regulator [Pseudomonas sp. GL-B-16]|uniref:TetR/AcrR family transcriptional regulator n=1 Tax=Pseudomonas sp. GL-B-16 TaxID=2832373 RepID=UPI001CBAED1D|nr:TetR/AcrR family transcriptional regulator [Pseudomonas sp. GL-B-16]